VIVGGLRNCGRCGRSLANATRQKNPIPAVKENRFDCYTRSISKFRTLIARRNPSARRKNFSNTEAGCWRNTTEIDAEIGALVTTNHVLLQRHAGKNATLLPIWRPIFSALWVKSKRENQKGGRGGQPGAPRQKCSINNLARKFCPKGSLPYSCSKKIGRPTSEHF
jgi:hypothetical protein